MTGCFVSINTASAGRFNARFKCDDRSTVSVTLDRKMLEFPDPPRSLVSSPSDSTAQRYTIEVDDSGNVTSIVAASAPYRAQRTARK